MNYLLKLFRSVLAVPVALFFGLLVNDGALAQDYSNIYVFGGSYSDAGAYLVKTDDGYEARRWTINPAKVWNQRLGDELGFTITSNQTINVETGTVQTPGGTNYAQGGARVSQMPGLFHANTRSLKAQIEAYIVSNGGKADPNALYLIEGGANDIFYQANQIKKKNVSMGDASNNMEAAANDLVALVDELQKAGAKNIVILDIHDIGKAPIALSHGFVAHLFLQHAAKHFNHVLKSGLDALDGGNIILADTYGYLNDVTKDSAANGFSDVKDPACAVEYAINCTADTLNPGASATAYFYSDGIHMTGPGHELLAGYISSLLPSAGQDQ